MPTCLCNREEALEILSQNLYPKTYDKLNEEYDRLKKYNKKLKQIEFYIDIMVNSLRYSEIECFIHDSDSDFDEEQYEEDIDIKYINMFSQICSNCGSFEITSDVELWECYDCNKYHLCSDCYDDHNCNRNLNSLNNCIKNNNYICDTCETKSYFNKILLLNNINSIIINNKLLHRKIYNTIMNIIQSIENDIIDVMICTKCCKVYDGKNGWGCDCNIEYNCEIKQIYTELLNYINSEGYIFDHYKILEIYDIEIDENIKSPLLKKLIHKLLEE